MFLEVQRFPPHGFRSPGGIKDQLLFLSCTREAFPLKFSLFHSQSPLWFEMVFLPTSLFRSLLFELI